MVHRDSCGRSHLTVRSEILGCVKDRLLRNGCVYESVNMLECRCTDLVDPASRDMLVSKAMHVSV